MRNKQAVEILTDKAFNAIDYLHKDIDSNKPHITQEYVKVQLGQALAYLESLKQYLDLEE